MAFKDSETKELRVLNSESADLATIETLRKGRDSLQAELSKVIVGQKDVVDQIMLTLFCRGHALMVGVPGLAKTLMIRTLAQILDLSFNRIQFTPDLMPSDIVGTDVIEEDQQTRVRNFRFIKGPVFANLVLADEINRTPPKTQAALLQAMEEHRVTASGTTYVLPEPFFVLATQNPIEQEGTYPLPEAQTDRFLFKLIVDYPSSEEEASMMQRWGQVTQQPVLAAASSGEELLALRAEVDRIHVSPAVQGYILALVRGTRALTESAGGTKRYLNFGASPRASLALFQSGRALAWLRGQDYVSPALIQDLAPDVLRHRIGLTYEAEAEEISPDRIVAQVVEKTPVPAK